MLWMQFHSARRALGSIPVVGSSCNQKHSQAQIRPLVQQETHTD